MKYLILGATERMVLMIKITNAGRNINHIRNEKKRRNVFLGHWPSSLRCSQVGLKPERKKYIQDVPLKLANYWDLLNGKDRETVK